MKKLIPYLLVFISIFLVVNGQIRSTEDQASQKTTPNTLYQETEVNDDSQQGNTTEENTEQELELATQAESQPENRPENRPENKAEIPVPQNPVVELPQQVRHKVPFVAQAPFADWADPDQQDGCEEMSVLMAVHWAQNKTLGKQEALDQLKAIIAYEKATFGYSSDTNIADTAQIVTDFLQFPHVEPRYNVTLNDIRTELAAGNVIVAPMQGQRLNNPNFTGGGPERHMLVITGYDDRKQQFITNDPGTRNGEEFRYSYETIEYALLEYPSGYKVPITEEKKSILVVRSATI